MISWTSILSLALLASSPLRGAPAASRLVSDSSVLQFHGFEAGARLSEIEARLRRLGGGRLRCDQAKADRRVSECRAVITDADLGGTVNLWVSAIDSVAGVITLSSDAAGDRLDRWRRRIEASYGRVGATVRGSEWMMQWVRRGRMLRLTWRTDHGAKAASVSLVDGRVLDGWGRSRARPAGSGPS
ncbi:MAG TPA: hypothetical protein VHR41_11115 [Gemmatimonadales bacterium]|jgi:hypothetical protein|nr:hypothetical protein [Gemmatimonadales bacterium]